jgi:hypothetical protein
MDTWMMLAMPILAPVAGALALDIWLIKQIAQISASNKAARAANAAKSPKK